MIDENDKRIYFKMSFLEQMCWLQEEVEYLFRGSNLEHLREAGIERYGEPGYGCSIKRLFTIIKADPKNRAYLREVISAEKELIAFIYGKINHCNLSIKHNFFINYFRKTNLSISSGATTTKVIIL